MSAKVYKQFNATEIKSLQLEMGERLSSWAQAWIGSSQIELELDNAHNARHVYSELRDVHVSLTEENLRYRLEEEHILFCNLEKIKALLFTVFEDSSLQSSQQSMCMGVEQLHEALLRSLADAIRAPSRVRSAADNVVAWCGSAECAQIGSGWLFARVSLHEKTFSFFVSGSILDTGSHRNTPPESNGVQLRKFIGDKAVSLEVKLGSIELSIGDFQSLQKGDVLILDKTVLEKASVFTRAGDEVCKGSLGTKKEHRAIKITAS